MPAKFLIINFGPHKGMARRCSLKSHLGCLAGLTPVYWIAVCPDRLTDGLLSSDDSCPSPLGLNAGLLASWVSR
ncbi:uncharacterized protein BO96DRAFT_26777 [Aspergillus niger CBS 101883]|uniref:uncharacterized protein n=1 Tax=Aspergillus lacticoffeatus (strain CBS 101883) TaxID=1450533 RepID=UPI000D7F4787|nr:uncharacterized protein BO96DRAFT_26777 [Aspergillus niger CBS 101883]PYH62981.1 hypothetical protein BO96DRAFT_26777 [Aspergillus niger CBS 101883]